MNRFPVVLATLLLAGTAQASTRLGGIAEIEYAVQPADGEAQKAELIVVPEFEWRSAFGFDLTAIARLRTDAYDRLEPGTPPQDVIDPWTRRGFIGDRTEVELREFYVEAYLGATYLRAGKQQIVWGEADGLKVLDLVNPQSFREFILDEFEDSRIPLWSLQWEVPLGETWTGQFLFIPDQTYNELPGRGAVFEITSPELVPQPPPGVPFRLREPDTPDRVLADADAGVQFSAYLGRWDVTVNYLYHYFDNPAVFLERNADGVVARPEFRRTHTFGGTVSSAFGDFTVRGEAGYSTDRFFVAADPGDSDGVVEAGELSYVAGLDWTGLTDTLISVQLFQSWADMDDEATRDALETDVTLLAERTFRNETLTLGVLAIHDADRGDGVVSPSISYDYLSNLIVRLRADVFYGPRDGRFGQFDQQDRMLVGVEYGF